ncbi:hypothetical protein GF406_13830 [candidate division KSB1 bacterium]|nr:hypothetical protein [candidate division KSB1 bacterium]
MKKAAVILCTFVMLYGGTLLAQTGSSPQSRELAAQYFLGSEDQILMAVNVWGFVNRPGQYMVPYDTDLISLLSYAGGPREEAKVTSIRVVRGVGQKEEDERVFEIDVKKFLETGTAELIPTLKPGDTVVVSGTTFHFVSRFFDFAWRIAAIVQVYAFVTYYAKRD